MKLLGTLMIVTYAMQAQSPDLKSASGYPKIVQKQVTAWIERAAEKMPEEEFAFKPDPAVRSFGQILGHVADANYSFCSLVLGESSPSPGIEKSKTTKAELTVALGNAFAYCSRAYDALTDANANETVKAFGQERNKLGVLWFNASHNLEHYGNLVVYMRMKGVIRLPANPSRNETGDSQGIDCPLVVGRRLGYMGTRSFSAGSAVKPSFPVSGPAPARCPGSGSSPVQCNFLFP